MCISDVIFAKIAATPAESTEEIDSSKLPKYNEVPRSVFKDVLLDIVKGQSKKSNGGIVILDDLVDHVASLCRCLVRIFSLSLTKCAPRMHPL